MLKLRLFFGFLRSLQRKRFGGEIVKNQLTVIKVFHFERKDSSDFFFLTFLTEYLNKKMGPVDQTVFHCLLISI